MSTIRIWAVKSHHDAKAIKRLANQLVADSHLENLFIQTVDKKAFLIRKGNSLSEALRKATRHYLLQDDRVIFLADSSDLMLSRQQPQESVSLIHQIKMVVYNNVFDGRVFLAQDVQELRAWLPIAQKSLEGDSTAWQKEWNNVVTSFHDAFANTPEDEVARNLDETLAEVRRERT